MDNIPRHADGRKDSRYTIRLEWCGHGTAQWVVRFCRNWAGSADDFNAACRLAMTYEAIRQAELDAAF